VSVVSLQPNLRNNRSKALHIKLARSLSASVIAISIIGLRLLAYGSEKLAAMRIESGREKLATQCSPESNHFIPSVNLSNVICIGAHTHTYPSPVRRSYNSHGRPIPKLLLGRYFPSSRPPLRPTAPQFNYIYISHVAEPCNPNKTCLVNTVPTTRYGRTQPIGSF